MLTLENERGHVVIGTINIESLSFNDIEEDITKSNKVNLYESIKDKFPNLIQKQLSLDKSTTLHSFNVSTLSCGYRGKFH
jgi:hypothetical protein